MKKFNEEKIIKVLQEAEGDYSGAGMYVRKHPNHRTEFLSLAEQSRQHDVTVLEVRRLKELEHDNTQLRQIVADLTLGNRILRDVNQKKW